MIYLQIKVTGYFCKINLYTGKYNAPKRGESFGKINS